jgi:prevent-host-death family protein
MRVNILEAKNRLSQLIKSAQAGEEVIIANRGQPVARLVAITEDRGATGERGSARTILDWLAANPLPEYLRRTPDEIDASIEEERNAWD